MKSTIKVVEPDQLGEADALVCMRVSDLPIPPVPSELGSCGACAERIWVSFTSPKKPRRLCIPCVVADIGEGDLAFAVTTRTLAESLDYLRRRDGGGT